MMKRMMSFNLLTRFLSLPCYLSVAALEGSAASFFHGASAASAVVLLCPLSYEKPGRSFTFACILVALLAMVQWFTGDSALIVITGAAVLLVYCIVSGADRFRVARALFVSDSPWHFVESYARSLWTLLWLVLSFAGVWFKRMDKTVIPVGAVLTLFYLAVLVRAGTGKTWMLSSEGEDELKKMMARTFNNMPADNTEEGKRLSQIYERAAAFMEERKPFLDEKFSMPILAGMIYTNKVSLSRAISYCTGGNFCQFANRYKVGYAVELMKRDTRMKVFEVSELSGFHNTVTFGLAFKMVMGKTPGEYKEELAVKKRL